MNNKIDITDRSGGVGTTNPAKNLHVINSKTVAKEFSLKEACVSKAEEGKTTRELFDEVINFENDKFREGYEDKLLIDVSTLGNKEKSYIYLGSDDMKFTRYAVAHKLYLDRLWMELTALFKDNL